MTEANHKRRGRPPAGQRPGDRVVDYPQLALRVPPATYHKLQAIARLDDEPQWRVLAKALSHYIDQLPRDQGDLIDEMVRRSERLLSQPAKSRRRSVAASPATLLNVDDNEPMLFARSAIFRAEGFNVLEAHNGHMALELARRHRPDVMLLDVHLPDINGIEICRRIKTDPATCAIKVVQLSATTKSARAQLEGLENGGADIFLTEPLSRGTLVSVVNRLLKGTAA